MANTKISALASGNPAQAGDLLPIDRAGSNFSVTASSITALLTANPFINTAVGAASASQVQVTGTVFTGGTGTTTTPSVYLNSGATAPTTWATNGTVFGINAQSGFNANFLDFRVNGSSTRFSIDANGTLAAGGAYVLNGSTGVMTSYGTKGTAGRGVPAIYASVSQTGNTTSISGNLQVGGAIAPAGLYVVKIYMVVTTANTTGNLNVNIGWNDGTATRTASNGTLGMPADISTSATNVAQGQCVVLANGVNNITYAFNVTQTSGTATFAAYATLERLQ